MHGIRRQVLYSSVERVAEGCVVVLTGLGAPFFLFCSGCGTEAQGVVPLFSLMKFLALYYPDICGLCRSRVLFPDHPRSFPDHRRGAGRPQFRSRPGPGE